MAFLKSPRLSKGFDCSSVAGESVLSKIFSCSLGRPENGYHIITKVPIVINIQPTIVFRDKVSFRNTTARMTVRTMLNLSTGTTWDALPSCRALK